MSTYSQHADTVLSMRCGSVHDSVYLSVCWSIMQNRLILLQIKTKTFSSVPQSHHCIFDLARSKVKVKVSNAKMTKSFFDPKSVANNPIYFTKRTKCSSTVPIWPYCMLKVEW